MFEANLPSQLESEREKERERESGKEKEKEEREMRDERWEIGGLGREEKKRQKSGQVHPT